MPALRFVPVEDPPTGRVLLLGGSGLLGGELAARATRTVGRTELDLSAPDFDLPDGDWDWIVNCAAYTAVDRAESEPELAHRVNAEGPARLARLARVRGARLLHVSTDFVFDGERRRPYREDDATNPLGVYGRSKRDGEEAVLGEDHDHMVVRTSWLFGNGPCFPATMIRRWEAGAPLRVVDDQRGSPSFTADVAGGLRLLMSRNALGGIYHAAGVKALTWWEFAEAALNAWRREDDPEVRIEPITTAEFPTPAPRPAYSVLDPSRLLGLGWQPKHLDDALRLWARWLRGRGGPL